MTGSGASGIRCLQESRSEHLHHMMPLPLVSGTENNAYIGSQIKLIPHPQDTAMS